MKLSRRELVTVAGGALAVVASDALAVSAVAQTAPPAPADLNQAARDSGRRISEALSKFDIPMPTEPAFQFKA